MGNLLRGKRERAHLKDLSPENQIPVGTGMTCPWKESERLFWIVVYAYVTFQIAWGIPQSATGQTVSRPATLVELSWAAEGNDFAAEHQQANAKLQEHFQWMAAHLPPKWGRYSLQERGEWVFESMHDRLLTGEYLEDQNALSTAILEGDFNCVSATILYQILADYAGLPTMAMQTRGHVWCRLLSRPELDIETTCPTWFLLEPHDQSQSPGIQAGDGARALSAYGLVAKIPYNRASLLAAEGDYHGAIAHLDRSLSLDPADPAARKNRVAILNNWAVQCIHNHDGDQALKLIEKIESQHSVDADITENQARMVDAVIDEWVQEGRYAEAIRLLHWKQGASRWSLRSVYEDWIDDAKARGEWLEAKNVLREAITALAKDPLTVAQLRRQYRNLLPS
ncbi:tetratricopeptide repeat protein [Blastopirellula marina]|uniref:Uncharacterized protein n=1 Tax=Blastopirellula marina TaxID=124 RepID=A0A2S8GC81_9BACT|nr:tetratricopeptide repeat protein [Blastopirellula marina]PQO42057.1 hypothetical protein C5Y93_27280 [Blastopirellula marina]